MGDIHQLVLMHGQDRARDLVPAEDRRLVDIAAKVLAEASTALGITYSGFCMTSLPHKRQADDAVWHRKSPRLSLLIEPGWLEERGEPRQYGVPYGSRARLILLYLQTQAVRANSPEVELGRSMYEWLDRMGIPPSGQNYKDIREQANRISACRLTFSWPDPTGRGRGFQKESIVQGGIQLWEADPRQSRLWVDTVRLSDNFFRALRDHPVPVWEPALRHISGHSMALDVYIWLAYRLHNLEEPVHVRWAALHTQFGAGYKLVRQFKAKFIEPLRMALAVYPEARVEIDTEGLLLHRSPPPIPERLVRAVR